MDFAAGDLLPEGRLQRLLAYTRPENRLAFAVEWQRQGKKVIGVLGSCIPEEIIHAAGLLPVRVIGCREGSTELARIHRPAVTCAYGTHVLESALRGEYDSLDGLVVSDRDQDLVRAWDVWSSLGKPAFSDLLHVPRNHGDLACDRLAKELRRIAAAVRRHFGLSVTDDNLRHSIGVYDRSRSLLFQAYQLRKRHVPPLSGAEYLSLVLACSLTRREWFNSELEALLPYLQDRRAALSVFEPRILVCGDLMDSPEHMALVESAGCLVAMDDLDTGSRYFWQGPEPLSSDPYQELAERYLRRPAGPQFVSWDAQAERMVSWVREFGVAGVLQLALVNDKPTEMRSPILSSRLNNAGIPYTSFERQYSVENVGQLRTRVEAFLEMVQP